MALKAGPRSSPYAPDKVAVLRDSPILMTPSERLLLYALVHGLRPARCLEIGTFQGGSAAVCCAALDALGQGRLVCLDPDPAISPDVWRKIRHRTVLLPRRSSVEALEEARRRAGGGFDFVLIDGSHHYPHVLEDLAAAAQFMRPGAFLLLHDAHFPDVAQAIEDALKLLPLTDCGLLCTERCPGSAPGPKRVWGGLRLLRLDGGGAVSPTRMPAGRSSKVSILLAPPEGRTPSALESIRRHTEPGTYELLAVERSAGSRWRRLARLRASWPELRPVRGDPARGFAQSVNRAMNLALGTSLLLLEAGTAVPPGWLNRLQAHLKRPVGAAAPLSDAPEAPWQRPTPLPEASQEGLARYAAALALKPPALARRVPYLSHRCLLVSREAVRRAGRLNERLPPERWGPEFCLRLQAAGYQVALAEDVYARHVS